MSGYWSPKRSTTAFDQAIAHAQRLWDAEETNAERHAKRETVYATFGVTLAAAILFRVSVGLDNFLEPHDWKSGLYLVLWIMGWLCSLAIPLFPDLKGRITGWIVGFLSFAFVSSVTMYAWSASKSDNLQASIGLVIESLMLAMVIASFAMLLVGVSRIWHTSIPESYVAPVYEEDSDNDAEIGSVIESVWSQIEDEGVYVQSPPRPATMALSLTPQQLGRLAEKLASDEWTKFDALYAAATLLQWKNRVQSERLRQARVILARAVWYLGAAFALLLINMVVNVEPMNNL